MKIYCSLCWQLNKCICTVLYFSAEYQNYIQNIIILFWKYLVDVRSEAWLNLFWEYIKGILFEVYFLLHKLFGHFVTGCLLHALILTTLVTGTTSAIFMKISAHLSTTSSSLCQLARYGANYAFIDNHLTLSRECVLFRFMTRNLPFVNKKNISTRLPTFKLWCCGYSCGEHQW